MPTEIIRTDYENYIDNDDTPFDPNHVWVHIENTPEEEAAMKKEWLEVFIPAQYRAKRNKLLSDSDWTQTNSSPLSDEKKAEWVTYRQALRDISLQEGFFTESVIWPTKPDN